MQIIKIQDLYCVVKDGITLSDAEIKRYQSLPQPDIRLALNSGYPDLDFPASRNLEHEMILPYQAPHGLNTNELSDNNELKKEISRRKRHDKLTYFYTDYTISDAIIPNNLQASGLNIKRQVEFYQIKYDSLSNSCYIADSNGQKIPFNGTRGTRDSDGITIVDKIFGVDKESLNIINKVKALISSPPAGQTAAEACKNLHEKERIIYANYSYYNSHYLEQKQKVYSLTHELHHEQNRRAINARRSDFNSGNLSIEEHFRLLENDEKTAHIAETLAGIKIYYKKNENLDYFPQKCEWLVADLKNLTPSERNAKLQDMDYIVNGTINNWDKNYAQAYRPKDKQFSDLIMSIMYDAPAHKLYSDNQEYLHQRSLLFTLPVYNRITGKDEMNDLSSFISKDVEITPQIENDYLNKAKNHISYRQQKLNDMGLDATMLTQMSQGTFPDNAIILPNNKTTTFQENIDPTAPSSTGADNDDFKKAWRDFYTKKAKQENSNYSEDLKSVNYDAKLQRTTGEELQIIASPDSHVAISAKDAQQKSKIPNYEDFNDLVLAAKQQNRIITLGNIKTPEYRARLILACLENDVEIKNLPNFETLKGIDSETRNRLMSQKIKLLRKISQDKENKGEYSGLNDADKAKREKIINARNIVRQARKNGNTQNNPDYTQALDIIKARQQQLKH